MPSPSLVDTFVSRLEKLGITYTVTGAVASVIYGEPRLTNDVDLVVRMKDEDIERLAQAFPATEFYCPPAEVLKTEMRRSYLLLIR
jgi:ABC-type molybdate transport system permease subunit